MAKTVTKAWVQLCRERRENEKVRTLNHVSDDGDGKHTYRCAEDGSLVQLQTGK